MEYKRLWMKEEAPDPLGSWVLHTGEIDAVSVFIALPLSYPPECLSVGGVGIEPTTCEVTHNCTVLYSAQGGSRTHKA